MADNEFCGPDSTTYTKWSTLDWLLWHAWPEALGGGKPHLDAYKDAWVVHNRSSIFDASKRNNIPPTLLAGVAWTEAGGKPDESKKPAFIVRAFDWSGPAWIDQHLTISDKPGKTSFGAVSIQLRVSARLLGLDAEKMSFTQQMRLIHCLETDVFNLNTVAKLLHDLILFDYPNANTAAINDEQYVVAGSRYNRGTARALSDIVSSLKSRPGSKDREYSEYGRSMLNHRAHILYLLGQ